MEQKDKLIALWTTRYKTLMDCAAIIQNNPELVRDLQGTAAAYRQCANELRKPPEELFKKLKLIV